MIQETFPGAVLVTAGAPLSAGELPSAPPGADDPAPKPEKPNEALRQLSLAVTEMLTHFRTAGDAEALIGAVQGMVDWAATDPDRFARRGWVDITRKLEKARQVCGVESHRKAAGLSDVDQNDVQLRGGARPTEKAAAWAVFPKTGTQRRDVLTLIAESGDGRTDQEIEADLALRPSSASTRRSELEQGGWVEDSGVRRLTAAGNESIVWVLTAAARIELAA